MKHNKMQALVGPVRAATALAVCLERGLSFAGGPVRIPKEGFTEHCDCHLILRVELCEK